MKKQKQTVLRRFFGSRLFLGVALILVIFIAIGYARGYYQDYKIREEIKILQEEVKLLEYKKLESMEILKYVTSPAFVEEKARMELNMKKPGENVLVVQNQFETQEISEKAPVENYTLNNPIKWWYYFIHRDLNKSTSP